MIIMTNSNWSEVILRDLADVKHGFAFQGEFFTDKETQNILLTPGNFAIGGGYKGDKLKYYLGKVPEDYVLNRHDVIVTMTDLSKNMDTLGYSALVPEKNGKRFLHNQRLGKVLIKDKKKLDKYFLYYLLRTTDYRNEILASASGSVIKHTSPDRIKNYKFLLPPLPEQRAIAGILGVLDDKIEVNRRMNVTLESIARARFSEMMKDEDGRMKIGTIEEDFNLTMGQSPPGETYNDNNEGIPFFQGRADFGFRYPENRVYCTAPTRFAKPGDTLVSVRAPVGDVNMAKVECAIGRGVAAVRHKTDSRSYTYYAMKSLESDFAKFEAEGTVFGSINKTDFQNLEIKIPTSEQVNEFEKTCYPIDQMIENNEKESRTLARLRDSMLPKLMSGEVRVKNVEGKL